MAQLLTPEEAAALVPDGASIGMIAPAPMAIVRALVKRGARNLHLVGVPTGGLAADLLIGAGCAGSVESSAVQLGESGFAPHFSRAAVDRSVRIMDST